MYDEPRKIRIIGAPPSPRRRIQLQAGYSSENDTGPIITPRRRRRSKPNHRRRTLPHSSYGPEGDESEMHPTTPKNYTAQIALTEVQKTHDNTDINVDIESIHLPNPEPIPLTTPYQYFIEAVFAEECAIYQLSQRLFVVNGWNRRTNMITVSSGYIIIN